MNGRDGGRYSGLGSGGKLDVNFAAGTLDSRKSWFCLVILMHPEQRFDRSSTRGTTFRPISGARWWIFLVGIAAGTPLVLPLLFYPIAAKAEAFWFGAGNCGNLRHYGRRRRRGVQGGSLERDRPFRG
jgi:hypothetical protein